MRALLDSNPEYQTVTVMRVDWDTYGGSHSDDAIVKELQVRRRSTLIMFSNGKEVGRVVAETGAAEIEALFKAAL